MGTTETEHADHSAQDESKPARKPLAEKYADLLNRQARSTERVRDMERQIDEAHRAIHPPPPAEVVEVDIGNNTVVTAISDGKLSEERIEPQTPANVSELVPHPPPDPRPAMPLAEPPPPPRPGNPQSALGSQNFVAGAMGMQALPLAAIPNKRFPGR